MVSLETSPRRNTRSSVAAQQFGRFFSYVSAAGLSRSPRQRWEAIHAAIQMLWDKSDSLGRSVTEQQLDQLFSLDPQALQSVLPQLVYYVLSNHGSPVAREVQAFLLRTCTASPSFAYELYWLLLAQPRPADAAAAGSTSVHAGTLTSLGGSVNGLQAVCSDDVRDTGKANMSPPSPHIPWRHVACVRAW